MSDLYMLKTAGTVPVSLAEMKTYMKVTTSSNDTLITSMLSAATTWGENYTGREFRANTWTLLIDAFAGRICLWRNPIASITHVKYLVATVLTTIATSVYYKKDSTQFSEILLSDEQTWPTDLDEIEHGIEIEFVTQAYRDSEAIKLAMKRHVAYWYQNRGDCSDCGKAATESGAALMYDQFRISRV